MEQRTGIVVRDDSAALVRGRAQALAQAQGACCRAVVMLAIHGDVDCSADMAYQLARIAAHNAALVLD